MSKIPTPTTPTTTPTTIPTSTIIPTSTSTIRANFNANASANADQEYSDFVTELEQLAGETDARLEQLAGETDAQLEQLAGETGARLEQLAFCNPNLRCGFSGSYSPRHSNARLWPGAAKTLSGLGCAVSDFGIEFVAGCYVFSFSYRIGSGAGLPGRVGKLSPLWFVYKFTLGKDYSDLLSKSFSSVYNPDEHDVQVTVLMQAWKQNVDLLIGHGSYVFAKFTNCQFAVETVVGY